MKEKRILESVRKKIEAAKGTRIWGDYINALKLISQVVFTRSSGFVLELIQNAEDSGLGLKTVGEFLISVNMHRVKITHNGRPFNEDEIKALCGIRSSKKPEKGTLGYLGIGFKSVFKVTDCPEVYSNGFQFKFDRNYWSEPASTPWHVLPLWLDKPSEVIDSEKTTFMIPFREESYYQDLVKELANLNVELYLFLRWLKRIEVTDEVSGRTWTLENLGESEDGITTLRRDGEEQKFKFFRRTLKQIPDWVKQDRLTQEYRANVTQREISIAFALDKEGDLAPLQAGAMYGGVYSFLPLGEAKSGAKFPIQADFLVQPGREAINYEANWNHWLVEEVAKLCKEAIEFFKKDAKWKFQFLPAFEFAKFPGLESYDKLFGPKLIKPLEDFIRADSCVPTSDGSLASPGQVVKLSEDEKASEDLVTMGILKQEEVATVLGGKPGLKLVASEVKECDSFEFKKVDRHDLLSNDAFLEEKSKQPDAANWFRQFYLWLRAHSRMTYTRKGAPYQEGYWGHKIVLTADENLLEGGKVWLVDFQPSDPVLKDLAKTSQQSKTMLHPSILAGAKDEEQQGVLKGFLRGLTGVQVLDSKAVCKDTLLPKILTTAPKPSPNYLLQYTRYCQQILGDDIPWDSEFWVLTKEGDIRVAKETLLPKEFSQQDWETHQQFVPGLNFVSPDYVVDITDIDQLKRWCQFFEKGGVKQSPDNGVEVFAEHYARAMLEATYAKITPVDKLNLGYDVEAETQTGKKICIEIKGQSHDQDVELKGNELDAADIHKDSFYLCVVSSIPENPTMHMVNNPAAPGVGKKDKLTIPVSTWKAAKW